MRDADGAISDFRYVYANAAARSRVDGELVGRAVREVAYSDAVAGQIIALCEQALQSDKPISIERLTYGDGAAHTSVSLRAGRLDSDTVIVHWRDITLQEYTRERLGQWAAVFERAGWGVAVTENGTLKALNPAYAAMHGYTVAELDGAHVSKLMSGRAWDLAQEQLRRVANGGTLTFESEHVRRDGTPFPVEVNLTHMPGDDGQRYRVVHLHDISARKRRDLELAQREERFRAAVDTMLDPFAILGAVRDEHGTIVDFTYQYLNEAAAAANQHRGAITVGQRFLATMPEPMAQELFSQYARVAETGEGAPLCVDGGELDVRRGDGEPDKRFYNYRAVRLADGVTVTFKDVTEARRVVREVAEREEMFSAAVGSMLDPFAILRAVRDESGSIVDFVYEYVNDAACRENKLTREQHIGHRLLELLPEHEAAGLLVQYAQVVETGEPLNVDGLAYEDVWGDGRLVTRVFDYRVVKLGDGITITWRDVTERGRKDLQLARWGDIFEHASWGVAVSTGSGRAIEMMNPEFARMHGYTVDELAGKPVRALFPEDAWAEAPAHIRRAEETGSHSFESVHVRADGSTFPVMVNVTVARDADGEQAYRVVHLEDITRRKSNERALREAEARFRTTFDRAPAGIALISVGADSYGQVLQANEALGDVLGVAPDELRGRTLAQFIHPEDRAQDSERLATAATDKEGVGARYDLRLVVGDVETREVAVRLSPVTGERSSPYVIKHVIDISERRRFEESLRRLADHDALTGLFNRRRFGEELTRHLELVRRHEPAGAVLLIDLDNFKYVNDTLGHQVGDQLIRDAAQLLRSHLRASDTLARLGGDEFVALLPDGEPESALAAARHLGALFETSRLGERHGAGGQLTLSIGVKAIDDLACRLSWEELLAEADIALYAAKEAGRNRAVAYGDEATGLTRMHERMAWSRRLHDALNEDGLVLYAQPVVALQNQDGGPRYELLVRMVEPDGTLHQPGEFLPIAHRFGLMRRVDRQVIAKAIALAARSDPSVELAINISAESLGDPELADFIAESARARGVDPSRIMFELTETVAISNLAQAEKLAHRLHELGCKLALDDFGAGFGSFYYLKHLPFDYLKIDGAFVRELCAEHADQVMVQAMVQTARELGKKTVAEWVGDAQTMSRLIGYHVDYAQGYHISAPVPAEEALCGGPGRHAVRPRA